MNELYQKERTMPLSVDPVACPSGCNKNGTQCVEISKPVVLTPNAEVGTMTTVCQGSPTVLCVNSADGATCTVTLTQKVCVTVPVSFGIDLTEEDPTIACGGDTCTCR